MPNLIKREKVEPPKLELTLFAFSMVFLPKFNEIDLRLVISFIWIIVSVRRCQKNISIKRIHVLYFVFMLFIISYSLFVLLINEKYNFFIPLRYFRSTITLITIVVYFTVHNINSKLLVDSVIRCLLIHSSIVIAEIIYPGLENYFAVISGYSKKALEFRASGLVSGYDFAGTYINIGIFISVLSYMASDNKKYIFYSLIFLISMFMTSRIGVVILLLILIYLMYLSIRFKKKLLTNYLFTIFVIVGTLGLSFLALSMNMLTSLRENLISNVPLAGKLYSEMVYSYANYNITETINNQINVPFDISFILGIAERAPTDPGFLLTIYSIGFLGMFIVFGFYFFMLIRYKMVLKCLIKSDTLFNYRFVCLYATVFMIMIMLIMEFKLSFLFSTGMFELLMIFVVFIDCNYYQSCGEQ